MPTRPHSPDPSGETPRANAFGGLGAGLDFFQDWLKAAGSALPNMPGSTAASGMGSWAMPTLDPEELDKRIQDLKTVQFWLEQNTRMVAMSIQGLEVQKMTLSTLKGMNVSMDSLRDALKARTAAASAAMAPEPPSAATPAASPAPTPLPASAPAARPTHATWPASPFASWATAPATEAEAEASGSDDAPAAAQTPQASPAAQAAQATDAPADGTAPAGHELINPLRWWDTLTEQFTHLASQASQTAQTVGSSMSDLLNTSHASVPGHSGADAKARKAPRQAAARKTTQRQAPQRDAAPRKTAARKTAVRKATPKKSAKPATKG